MEADRLNTMKTKTNKDGSITTERVESETIWQVRGKKVGSDKEHNFVKCKTKKEAKSILIYSIEDLPKYTWRVVKRTETTIYKTKEVPIKINHPIVKKHLNSQLNK